MVAEERGYGVAALDVSTGEIIVQHVQGQDLEAELGRLEPSELLAPRTVIEDPNSGLRSAVADIPLTIRDDWIFETDVCSDELCRFYAVESLDGFGFQAADVALVRAAGSLIQYLKEVRPGGLTHLRPVQIKRPGLVMLLDEMG